MSYTEHWTSRKRWQRRQIFVQIIFSCVVGAAAAEKRPFSTPSWLRNDFSSAFLFSLVLRLIHRHRQRSRWSLACPLWKQFVGARWSLWALGKRHATSLQIRGICMCELCVCVVKMSSFFQAAFSRSLGRNTIRQRDEPQCWTLTQTPSNERAIRMSECIVLFVLCATIFRIYCDIFYLFFFSTHNSCWESRVMMYVKWIMG